MEERRKHPRISSQIRVEFADREGHAARTVNVSRNGVFVTGAGDVADNSLVRIKLYLPPEQEAIEVFGRVVWVGHEGDHPGIGIHFLELDSAERDRWLRFTKLVEKLEAGEPLDEVPEGEGSGPAGERRETPRTASSFLVRFKDRQSLESFVTRNLSAGGMFLATPVLKQLGTRIQVVMVHPSTAKDFELDAEVVRVNEESTPQEPKGMGLKFVELTETQQKELETFLS